MNRVKFSLILLIALYTFNASYLFSQDQSLWVDQNPYSAEKSIAVGSIIKILFKENIKTEFTVEIQTDDMNTIKTTPDKKMISELQPFNHDTSYVKNNKGKYKTTGNISGGFSVIVTRVDETNGNLYLSGTRESFYDNEKQVFRLTGVIAREAIKNKTVLSSDIANLRIEFSGKITPKQINDPDIQLKEKKAEDGSSSLKAELSDEEKQKIILKYMKRLLGESE